MGKHSETKREREGIEKYRFDKQEFVNEWMLEKSSTEEHLRRMKEDKNTVSVAHTSVSSLPRPFEQVRC